MLLQTNNLLFMLRPDLATAARTARLTSDLCRDHGLTGRPIVADRLHATIYQIGNYPVLPPPIVEAARRAAAAVRFRPFKVSFDRVTNFGKAGDNLIVLAADDGVIGLMQLREQLEVAVRAAALRGRSEGHAFNPHVTLIYTDKLIPPGPIEPISWTVSEFLLVQSLVGQSRHIVLGRWRLKDGEAAQPV